MTPAQKETLTRTLKRWAWIVPLVGSPLVWAGHTYDASKLDTATFDKYVLIDSARHAFDSLSVSGQLRRIQDAQARTDSNVRKICAAVTHGGC